MALYRITAEWQGHDDEVRFAANGSFEATTDAIAIVMDRAWHGNKDVMQPVWAHGLIRLWNERGEVLHTMPEKELD